MNQRSAYIAAIILLAATFSGCKKSDSTATINTPLSQGLKYKFANSTYTSNNVTITYYPWSNSIYYWATSGSSFSFPQLNFQLPRMAVGSYLLGSATDSTEGTVSLSFNGQQHISRYGKLVITDSGTYIRGTFQFTCSDSAKVTDGEFNVYYQP